ncbi:MAG: hypothetical protein JW765_04460 [Deltaproteobacteria bacterium]|nr:hypothetical protein [Candidatus Zymogenaceae bacterium]
MRDLTNEEAQAIRLQMLYNIGNGWSWYAYKRLGPEKIIELELEMWNTMLPPAVDILYMLFAPEGPPVAQAKHILDQMTKINGYAVDYRGQTADALKWEYSQCPNWNSLVMLNYDDYLAVDGKPAKVSCIHGCTRIHELYFSKIGPKVTVTHGRLRPNADETCEFTATFT